MSRVKHRAKKSTQKGKAPRQRRAVTAKLGPIRDSKLGSKRGPKRGSVPRKATNWLHARVRAVKRGQNVRSTLVGVMLGLCAVFILALWISGGMGVAVKAVQFTTERGLLAAGFGVSHIEVVGPAGKTVNSPDKAAVRKALAVEEGELVFTINLHQARKRVEKLGWVKEVRIMRQLPNRLTIVVVERAPFALWQSTTKMQVISANGNLIGSANPSEHTSLPMAVGTGAPQALGALLVQLENFPNIAAQIHAHVRVSDRRWNLRLKSGADLMLPAYGPAMALALIENNPQLIALLKLPLRRIDARIAGQILVRKKTEPLIVDDKVSGNLS